MKIIRPAFCIILVLYTLLSSCSLEKRRYSKGYFINWKSSQKVSKKIAGFHPKTVQHPDGIKEPVTALSLQLPNAIETPGKLPLLKSLFIHSRLAFTLEKGGCDIIIFKNGDEIRGKVVDIGADEIKYQRCKLGGPVYSVKKSDVYSIKYSNGTTEVINPLETKDNNETKVKSSDNKAAAANDRVLEAFSVFSFIASIIGLFALALIMGFIAVVLGTIGLVKIGNDPDIWKGGGFAIIGILVGIIDIGAILIFLSIL